MNDHKVNQPSPRIIVKSLVSSSDFERNCKIKLDGLVEKRNGSFRATYLSWATALRLLRKHHDDLFVDFERTMDGNMVHENDGDGGYLLIYLGRHDEPTNSLERTPSMFFPLMDKTHSSITHASSRDINDNWMRGAVKAIAIFTGIGLPVFEGEDIPTQEEIDKQLQSNEFFDKVDKAEPVKERKRSPKKSSAPQGKIIFLNVPFEQKDMAKSAGAFWNQESKKWTISHDRLKTDFSLFQMWLSEEDKDQFLSVSDDINDLTDEISEQTAQDTEDDEDVPF